MSKETVVTDEQITDWMKTIGAYNISGYSIHGEYQFMKFARAIEKAVLEACDWQPIETAPKDGTEVLAWREDCGIFIASYTSASEFPMSQSEIDKLDEEALFTEDWFTQWPQAIRLDGSEKPTHWMPLPPPPKQPTLNDEGEQNGD